MSWVGVALVGGGAALSGTGSMISQKGNFDNQTGMAQASNAELAKSNAKQQGFAGQNADTLGTDLSFYQPDAQAKQLATAQQTRGANNVANISAPDAAPQAAVPAGTPPAVAAEYAKRAGAAHDYAAGVGQAEGDLGGYNDSFFQNSLRDQQANRDIGVTNSYSNEEKSLLPARQQLAQAAAYKQPSIWGPLLTGAGNMMASAGGSKLGGSAAGSGVFDPSNWNASLPSGSLTGV